MDSMRGRWSWAVSVLAVAAAAAFGAAVWQFGAVTAATPVGVRPSCPRASGMVAVVAQGGLRLVDLGRCRVVAVPAPGASEVRFSPDGRWLAYARRSRVVVMPARGGGRVREPFLSGPIVAWSWGSRGETLYGITAGGALVAALPGGARRTVAAGLRVSAYGADNSPLAISPDGSVAAVDVSGCRGPVGELDAVDLSTGRRAVVLREPGRFFTLAGWSPDGRWLLFWRASMCSGSLAADGWPLEAVPVSGGSPVRVIPNMLLFDDFLSWCGSRLVAAVGRSRETQRGSRLVGTRPPDWRARTIEPSRRQSWVSPSCAPGGRVVAAAAGRATESARFGIEHRSVWLLRPGGAVIRRLTLPPARDLSDEAPRFSHDGRWILFVRSRVVPVGSLSGISRDTLELVRADGTGSAVPILDFTSTDISYYDHFSWPAEIDWSDARR